MEVKTTANIVATKWGFLDTRLRKKQNSFRSGFCLHNAGNDLLLCFPNDLGYSFVIDFIIKHEKQFTMKKIFSLYPLQLWPAIIMANILVLTPADVFCWEFQQSNYSGRFYGKVVDESGNGISYATVQLFNLKQGENDAWITGDLVTGQITEDNGDFSLDAIPIQGTYQLKISFIGYVEVAETISFRSEPAGQKGRLEMRPSEGPGLEKDLGNILLTYATQSLEMVIVQGEKAAVTLALDRKVYRVDKDVSTAGGSAIDALKNVPSLTVDIDGNVALRNGAPQIFIDGRPSTLTLEQIAADAIETVEVITNPSAKYDAGGSSSGIVNIVLKKEKRLGYNGSIRAGTDTREGYNLGGDLNAASSEINLFLSGNINQRRGLSSGETYQQNFTGDPLTGFTQRMSNRMQGAFANVRGGLDWLVDNRNTLTFSSSFTHGQFNPNDVLNTTVDTFLVGGIVSSQFKRRSDQNRNFKNAGGSILFKHLFPVQGSEWTADLNFNHVRFLGSSNYQTDFADAVLALERQKHESSGRYITLQSDLVRQISPSIKIETGVRVALRGHTSDNVNQFFTGDTWMNLDRISDHYQFSDDVYAAYATYSQELGQWGYQLGLRSESSFYKGTLTGIDSSFNIDYPVSLFPSVFLTRKLTDGNSIQLSYTRRINRPNFFQTMPVTDISNTLNPRRGNPQLRPEFTNSLELSYQNLFAQKHNLLLSLYYKHARDLITAYLDEVYVEELGDNLVLTTFTNSNRSYAFGGEITLKNNLLNAVDLTSNINIYQSVLDASNVENSLLISRLSWLIKEQISIRFPYGITLQLSGEYHSKASFTPSADSRMPWGPPSVNTAQGYTLANWFVDAALKKDILNRRASLTLNINDIFRSRKFGTYTLSDLFLQETYRIRDPQVARLNFSYRFGKSDASLFKRKNMNQSMQGNDMMN